VANGTAIGSELIGQNFRSPEYFQPRPPGRNDGYDPTASGASNLGQPSQKLRPVKDSVASFRKNNPDYTGPIPADLVTASGSGLDRTSAPPRPKLRQRASQRRARHPVEQVRNLIAGHTQGRDLASWAIPRVNVLEINLALDQAAPPRSRRQTGDSHNCITR